MCIPYVVSTKLYVVVVSRRHAVTVRVSSPALVKPNSTPTSYTIPLVTSIDMPEGDTQSAFKYIVTCAIQEYANTHTGEVLTGTHNNTPLSYVLVWRGYVE